MLSFVKNVFSSKKQPSNPPLIGVDYHEGLTKQFEEEHLFLMMSYADIAEAIQVNDYEAIARLLEPFKMALKAHVAQEFKQLYTFIEHVLEDSDEKTDIRQFRTEMNHIAITVMRTLNQYSTSPVDADSIEKFKKEFQYIGETLVVRIQREENQLYPLYNQYGHPSPE